MQSDCLYSFLFFEHYSTASFYLGTKCWDVAAVDCLRVCHATMRSYFSTSLGISVLLCHSVVPSIQGCQIGLKGQIALALFEIGWPKKF